MAARSPRGGITTQEVPRVLLVPLLFVAACGGGDGTGPEQPSDLVGELAYLADGAVVVRDFDEGATRRFELDTEGTAAVWGMAWQPDGRAIVYSVFNLAQGWYELRRVPLDGSAAGVLFPNQGHQLAPAFLPDGRLS